MNLLEFSKQVTEALQKTKIPQYQDGCVAEPYVRGGIKTNLPNTYCNIGFRDYHGEPNPKVVIRLGSWSSPYPIYDNQSKLRKIVDVNFWDFIESAHASYTPQQLEEEFPNIEKVHQIWVSRELETPRSPTQISHPAYYYALKRMWDLGPRLHLYSWKEGKGFLIGIERSFFFKEELQKIKNKFAFQFEEYGSLTKKYSNRFLQKDEIYNDIVGVMKLFLETDLFDQNHRKLYKSANISLPHSIQEYLLEVGNSYSYGYHIPAEGFFPVKDRFDATVDMENLRNLNSFSERVKITMITTGDKGSFFYTFDDHGTTVVVDKKGKIISPFLANVESVSMEPVSSSWADMESKVIELFNGEFTDFEIKFKKVLKIGVRVD